MGTRALFLPPEKVTARFVAHVMYAREQRGRTRLSLRSCAKAATRELSIEAADAENEGASFDPGEVPFYARLGKWLGIERRHARIAAIALNNHPLKTRRLVRRGLLKGQRFCPSDPEEGRRLAAAHRAIRLACHRAREYAAGRIRGSQLADSLPPELPLGKPTPIPKTYAPDVLVAIPRAAARARLDLRSTVFDGIDLWEAPELSWLDPSGKPRTVRGEFRIPANSDKLIESKSLKLYLHSLNQERYECDESVVSTITRDLSERVECDVSVLFRPVDELPGRSRGNLPGTCIDAEPIEVDTYALHPDHLKGAAEISGASEPVEEALVTHLFRSLCPVTAQPDWASVSLRYRGPRIARDRLLLYWVSYRETRAFHEVCVERMFADLQVYCRPEWLEIDARFALRGGLAIHPSRKGLRRT